MVLYYPDVSNNNWSNIAQAVGFVKSLPGQGFSAVCHKVSEGDYFTDKYWPSVLAAAKKIGLLAIGYHYVTTNPPDSQAQTYLSNVVDPTVPCMLDFELGAGGIGNFWAVVDAFNAAGVHISLSYIPRWYWAQIGSPDISQVPGLVSSAYLYSGQYASVEYYEGGASSGVGWEPYGGATPSVWQFTDDAVIGSFGVDANAYRGTLNQFRQLLGVVPVSSVTATQVSSTNKSVPGKVKKAQKQVG